SAVVDDWSQFRNGLRCHFLDRAARNASTLARGPQSEPLRTGKALNRAVRNCIGRAANGGVRRRRWQHDVPTSTTHTHYLEYATRHLHSKLHGNQFRNFANSPSNFGG